ncbi:MAG: replication factor C large subunit [Nanoarchaeota archaeon]|nr:replication factor C large subunit [Nanoarchaeota archaeon]
MLTNKHKPKKLEHIKGQDLQIKQLKKLVLEKKPILIYGDTGTGKTASVHALVNELDYELLELNASDYRNKEEIENIIGNSTKQLSLFNKQKLILIDEIDGINTKDRGCIQALIKIIKESTFPIIVIANDIWDQKFKDLRKTCNLIEFNKPNYLDIYNILNEITEKENKKIDTSTLKEISRLSEGDVRAAINDLNTILNNGDLEDIYSRERKQKLLNVLKFIFKSKDLKLILSNFNSLDENLDEVFLWLEENIPLEYDNISINKAHNNLSKADVFRGRIIRWQYYRFLVYQSLLMSAGVSLSKEKKNNNFINYKRNSRILKMWLSKRKNAKILEKTEFIKENCNMSLKKARNELNYMKFL